MGYLSLYVLSSQPTLDILKPSRQPLLNATLHRSTNHRPPTTDPCIGHFRFLTLTLHTTPSYPSILSRLRSNPSTSILLDLGCCFGQELRRLLHDGAPASTLYGADLRPEFFDLGYELFRDGGPKTTGNGMKFIAADVFAPHSALDALDGRCDVVHASAFFHLFGLEKQKQVARRVVRLLKWNGDASEGERPIVLGRHVGAVVAGEYEHSTNEGGVMFRHNVESWREMWEGVGEELGMRFVVEGDLRTTDVFRVNNKDGEGREKEKEDAGIRQLWFCVTRME